MVIDGLKGELCQIGVVVHDINQGMEYYSKLLGLGPYWRLDTDYQGRYRDWEGRFANHNAFAKWGGIYLEMIQPVVGEGNAKEWLETRGPGIFHLGYAVDDMDQRPLGAPCVFESYNGEGDERVTNVLHLDTVKELGFFLEFMKRPVANGLNSTIDKFVAEAA